MKKVLCNRSFDNITCEPFLERYGDNWKISPMKIDVGADGDIYIGENKSNPNKSYIIKYIRNSQNRKQINNEICYQQRSAEIDLSPKVIDAWFCDKSETTGVIVMDKAGNFNTKVYISILKKYKDQTKQNFIKFLNLVKVFILIIIKTYKMNTRGVFHNDLHLGNITIKIDDNWNPEDIFIIDFGKSESWKSMIDVLYKIPENDIVSMLDYTDKIQRTYKSLYADRNAPFLFLKELIDENMNPILYDVINFILEKLYKEIIYKQYTGNFASWDMDLGIQLIDNFPPEIEEFIENMSLKYNFNMDETEIENAVENIMPTKDMIKNLLPDYEFF